MVWAWANKVNTICMARHRRWVRIQHSDNSELKFRMLPFFSAALINPTRWTESLLCVPMPHRLILDHSADTFHSGDFKGSKGNVLSPTGCCYLHSQPLVLTLCTICSAGQSASSSNSHQNTLGRIRSVSGSENDNLVVLTFAKMLKADVRH